MMTQCFQQSAEVKNSTACVDSPFDSFAQLISARLQQLDDQALPAAVNVIAHFLNIDADTKDGFISEVLQQRQTKSEESVFDELARKMAEVELLCQPVKEEVSPVSQQQVNFFSEIPPVYEQVPLQQTFIPALKVPSMDFQMLQLLTLVKPANFEHQTNSFSTDSSRQPKTKEIKVKRSAAEKTQFFREALIHVLKIKEETTDEQLCNIIKETKICMWKQISEYSGGMMTTKQVSDYFWKTFVRACYKDQLTQQDKNYLTQIAHQNPRSSAAYLYDVVKPRFEGRNVFHDNVKTFLNQIILQQNNQ
ncbi:Hypothetical_protein [Hexamita inflata]|uniref:Hypothetical_protein n=1 Tax=Hexamita inflata TaxID=28002 RepID=A0AA86V648_9EUKA|nr:Hypothetical protein HINF_LOCUS65432 [Hexamita inflata]